MPLWNLSYEKVEDIKRQCREKGIELEVLGKTTIKEMWLKDLSSFLEVLDKYETEEEEERKKNEDMVRKDAKGKKAKKVGKKGDRDKEKAKGNKKKGFDWDEDS